MPSHIGRWSVTSREMVPRVTLTDRYIHGEAQTSLVRFIVDVVLYKQVCNKYTRNRTDGAWALVGEQNRGPSSTTLLIAVNGVPWRNLYKYRVAHAKMGHVSQTTPLLGVIRHPLGKTWYNLPMYKLWQLQQPFLRYGWGPKKLQEALILQTDGTTRLSLEILQLQNISFEN